jgi:glutamate-1-semialdehyde 2,1-aminomutase
MCADVIAGIRQDRLMKVAAREAERFAAAHPKSKAALEKAGQTWLNGVPMHWMTDWPMPFLPVVETAPRARGSPISTATGSTISAWATPAACSAIRPARWPGRSAQARRGLTYMLPSEDRACGRALLLTALRQLPLADRHHRDRRQPLCDPRRPRGDGRPKILVFNGCYHGTVDDVMVELDNGVTRTRLAFWARSAT